MNTIKVGSLVVLNCNLHIKCVFCPRGDICEITEYCDNSEFPHRIMLVSITNRLNKCWFSKDYVKKMIIEIDSPAAKELFT
jgi:hypothetical protein